MRSLVRLLRSALLAAVLAAAVPAAPAAAQSTLEDAEFAHPLTGEVDSHLQCPDGAPAECFDSGEDSKIMVDGSNRTLVVYRASNYVSVEENVLQSHVRVNGVWSPATVIANAGTNSISAPQIIRLSNGNLLLGVNVSPVTDGPSTAVWDHRSSSWSTLTPLTAPAGANNRGARIQLAATSDGAVLLATFSGPLEDGPSRSDMGVLYRYTISSGWSEPQVLTDSTGDRLDNTRMRLTVLPDDTLLISFPTSCSCASLTAAYGRYVSVINPDGSYEAPYLLTSTSGSVSTATDIGFTERPDGFAAVAFIDPSSKLKSAIFDMVSREWTMTAITPDVSYASASPLTIVDRNDNVVIIARNSLSAVAVVSNGRPTADADWPSEPEVLISGPALATSDYQRSSPLGGAVLFASQAIIDNNTDSLLLLWGYDSTIGFTEVISIAQNTVDPSRNFVPESVGLDGDGRPSVSYRYSPAGRDVHVVGSNFDEPLVTVLPPYEAPAPEPAVQRPLRCELTPDVAVSPAEIRIAPGGRAQLEIAIRNLCNDRPYSAADLLLSLSDGLRVVELPAPWLNLGQRAAWQNLVLQAGETLRFVFTIEADSVLTATPQHITELYTLGRVATRIDGIFLSPAPADSPAAEPAPAAPTDSPAAVPALPATLPNTAGQTIMLDTTTLALLLVGLLLLTLSLMPQHRRRR